MGRVVREDPKFSCVGGGTDGGAAVSARGARVYDLGELDETGFIQFWEVVGQHGNHQRSSGGSILEFNLKGMKFWKEYD